MELGWRGWWELIKRYINYGIGTGIHCCRWIDGLMGVGEGAKAMSMSLTVDHIGIWYAGEMLVL